MPLKVLDYGKLKPFGETLGRPRNLAWPVNVYRVTLPKVSGDHRGLNPFERVILKIIDAGGKWEAESLAQETCIPVDLVRCVLLRLQDKNFIDEHNKIMCQDWKEKDKEPPIFVTALLFRELADGKILPYLDFLSDDKPLKKLEKDERSFRRIRCNVAYTKIVPAALDVIIALRAMQKRSAAFDNKTGLPAVKHITIASDPEHYYLDCPIAIRKSDGDFRIADPFGNGFSLILEQAFSRLLEQDKSLSDWLMTWKNNLSNIGPANRTARPKEPYDNDTNRACYPQLLSNLRLRHEKQFRSIEQIYAALEWALFYSCAQRSYASKVQLLKLTPQSKHPAVLQEAAKELLLELPPGGLSPVRDGKLDDFLQGKAEMETVLSLSLLMAAADAFHPLRGIAKLHRDFIKRVLKIKKNRDEVAHGAGRVRLQDVELPEESFMRKIVTALLPAIRFSDAPPTATDKEALSDALMDARTSIQSEFGFALFNRLGVNLQDRLIVAERFWLSCNDGDDALAFACDLYAALQAAFRSVLVGALLPDISDSEYALSANRIAKECGLGDLPKCMLTAKRSAIRETLLGNDQTLQSCIVAFLLVSSVDVLTAIAHTQPSFIADVARVIELRGHGNEPLPLSKDDIRMLRKSAYTTIKTLLEV